MILTSCDVLSEQDVRVISQAILVMSASNHCLITDRPDLGFQPETSWTTNFDKEIDALQDLIIKYGAHTITGQEYANSDFVQVRCPGNSFFNVDYTQYFKSPEFIAMCKSINDRRFSGAAVITQFRQWLQLRFLSRSELNQSRTGRLLTVFALWLARLICPGSLKDSRGRGE